MKERKVKAVLCWSESQKPAVDRLAAETGGVGVAYAHQVGAHPEAADWISMMGRNVSLLRAALPKP